MSVDHKRPLLAFAVVTVACIVILVNAVRSEAFVSALRSEASHVVSGLGLARADHRPDHRLERTPEAVPLVDAPRVAPMHHLLPAHRGRHATPAALHGVPSFGRQAPAHLVRANHAHASHAGGHGVGPDGHRAHGPGGEHGHHRGHGDHAGADQGDRGPANALLRGHPQPARQLR